MRPKPRMPLQVFLSAFLEPACYCVGLNHGFWEYTTIILTKSDTFSVNMMLNPENKIVHSDTRDAPMKTVKIIVHWIVYHYNVLTSQPGYPFGQLSIQPQLS